MKPKIQSQALKPIPGAFEFELFPAQTKSTQVNIPTTVSFQSCATCDAGLEQESAISDSDRVVFRD